MDIAALSIALKSSALDMQIKTGLLKLTMDTNSQNADMMVDIMRQMQSSIQPHLGQNIDILV